MQIGYQSRISTLDVAVGGVHSDNGLVSGALDTNSMTLC